MPVRERLAAGREAYQRGDWSTAFAAFQAADTTVPLSGGDLEAWASTAFLLGDQSGYERLLDRAHLSHLDRGDIERAAFCAAWLGTSLFGIGSAAQGNGWVSRARRLIEGVDHETRVHGYLRLAEALTAVAAGRMDDAMEAARDAADSAIRFNDTDLSAMALQLLGRAHLVRSELVEGFALLDEAMVAVASGAMNPQVVGMVYCSVIDGCRASYSLRRAFEWTEALTVWAERQPSLVAFTGECRVARAEMLLLRGGWQEALAETELALANPPRWVATKIQASAFYLQAEVMRLRGDLTGAEAAYARVAAVGGQVQPGLALLRLAQGRLANARTGLERALEETLQPLKRAALLPAEIELALVLPGLGPLGRRPTTGEPAEDQAATMGRARSAAAELGELAARNRAAALQAMASAAEGAVALLDGDVAAAAVNLSAAADRWRELAAPLETARVRVLLGLAYRALGDHEGAGHEFAAARAAFAELGAASDLERLGGVFAESPSAGRLTARELEVLAHLAAGATNRSIAGALGISERTVDRHVSNIFDKLAVTSRTEAASVALRRGLV